MDAYDVGGWDGYAIAMLGVAGVLVGLIFVALSVNMQQVLRYPWLVTRAGEAILELLAVLVACALLLVPGQSSAVLGTELMALSLASALAIGVPGLRHRESVDLAVRRRSDAQMGAGVVALGLFGLAGISLVAGTGGGLYWLVPATLAALGLATLNAWVLLVEVNR
jgi:hypothetical protein